MEERLVIDEGTVRYSVDVTDYWPALLVSLRVSLLAMLLIVPIGLWVSWRLAIRGPFRGRALLETLLFLPLVLPPTVVGYLLLLLFGRGTLVGQWLQDKTHLQLLFTWQGASVAAAIMSLPLFVRTVSAAFSSVESDLREMAQTLGASEGQILRKVLIPLSYRGVLAGTMLAFARAIGEFGATLMVAGSIPGKTETLSLALYSAVQAGEDRNALCLSLILLTTAFFFLSLSLWLSGRLADQHGERQ